MRANIQLYAEDGTYLATIRDIKPESEYIDRTGVLTAACAHFCWCATQYTTYEEEIKEVSRRARNDH